MPSSTLDDLLEAYTQISVKNRAILEEFNFIVRQFHEQGVAFIVLKGADVISRLYGVRGARPITDVDLLVHESDLPVIDRLLRNLGFSQQIDGNPAYASSERGLALDLITTIWYLDERELTALWSRAPTRAFGTTTISCLDTADLLVYLIAYSVIHRGHLSASFVQDVKLLVEQESPDWSLVLARVRQAELQIPLFHGLSHVRNTLPAVPIPDSVLSLLAPRTVRERMLTRLLAKLVTTEPLPEVGHLLLFLTQPDANKIRWLNHRLFPSASFLSYRYGSTMQHLAWRTRLCRCYHLTTATFKLIWRVLGRLTSAPTRVIQ